MKMVHIMIIWRKFLPDILAIDCLLRRHHKIYLIWHLDDFLNMLMSALRY